MSQQELPLGETETRKELESFDSLLTQSGFERSTVMIVPIKYNGGTADVELPLWGIAKFTDEKSSLQKKAHKLYSLLKEQLPPKNALFRTFEHLAVKQAMFFVAQDQGVNITEIYKLNGYSR